MRLAELVMAVAMAIFSLYLMWKSAELPIGWIEGSGPGGGAFPFWLSAGMLACTIWIIVRWVRRQSPPSRSEEPFMSRQSAKAFLVGAGSLTVLIGGISIVGVYVMIPLFLIFHMRYLGGHRWAVTGPVVVAMPVATFFFFEIALKITLPKGYTEPAFYPLYEYFLG
jgi:putative tricarboxylic transport membrane protein